MTQEEEQRGVGEWSGAGGGKQENRRGETARAGRGGQRLHTDTQSREGGSAHIQNPPHRARTNFSKVSTKVSPTANPSSEEETPQSPALLRRNVL